MSILFSDWLNFLMFCSVNNLFVSGQGNDLFIFTQAKVGR